MSDEVDFLHTDKHESLLQIDTMILMGQRRSSIPKVPKIASLQCLYDIFDKELERKLNFCMYINIKVSCKVILSLLLGMIKHSQSALSNKFSISLYFYIYKYIFIYFRKLGIEFIFCMQISIKVSTSWGYIFRWK